MVLPEASVALGSRPKPHKGLLGSNRQPWMVLGAIEQIIEHLPHTNTILEYGGGSSTVYWLEFSDSMVTTVEHHPGWCAEMRKAIKKEWRERWVLKEKPSRPKGKRRGSDGAFYDDYVAAGRGEWDMVVVDGRCRGACIEAAIPWVAPGGLLVVDNAERPKYAAAIAKVPSEWARTDHVCPCDTTIVFQRPTK